MDNRVPGRVSPSTGATHRLLLRSAVLLLKLKLVSKGGKLAQRAIFPVAIASQRVRSWLRLLKPFLKVNLIFSGLQRTLRVQSSPFELLFAEPEKNGVSIVYG